MIYNEETEKPRDMKHCDKIFTGTNKTFTEMIGPRICCQ